MRGLIWMTAFGAAGLLGLGAVAGMNDKKGPNKEEVAEKAAPFELPGDDAGKLLARELTPRLPPRLDGPRRPAKAHPVAERLAPPALVPVSAPFVGRLPAATASAARPRFARAEALLVGPGLIVPPARAAVQAKPVRVESADVRIPPPLPPVATPLPDRVPLDDPTAARSSRAVLTAPVPVRAEAVPFVRVGPPEPFEHRRPVSAPPAGEATTPQVEAPRPPGQGP